MTNRDGGLTGAVCAAMRWVGASLMIAVPGLVSAAHGQSPVTRQQAQKMTIQAAVVDHRAIERLATSGPLAPVIRVTPKGNEAIAATKDTVSLRPGDLLVKSTGSTPTPDKTLHARHFDLPTRIFAPTATQTVAQFTIAVRSDGLAFSTTDNQFAGVVFVWLDDSLHRTSARQLTTPIVVQVSAHDPSVRVEPGVLTIEHTNIPYTQVRISGSTSQRDTVFVLVQPSFDAGHKFGVPVVRPSIGLVASPTTIAGFGLEKARLSVELPVSSITGSRAVTIAGKRSRPAAGSVSVSPGSPGSTDIPSVGIGSDTIEASSDPFKSGTVVVQYTFPYLYILLAIIGGAAGAVVKIFTEKDKGGVESKQLVLGVCVGVLIGLVTAIAAALGINLTSLSLPSAYSEGIAFVVAAVGAIGGISIFKGAQRAALPGE